MIRAPFSLLITFSIFIQNPFFCFEEPQSPEKQEEISQPAASRRRRSLSIRTPQRLRALQRSIPLYQFAPESGTERIKDITYYQPGTRKDPRTMPEKFRELIRTAPIEKETPAPVSSLLIPTTCLFLSHSLPKSVPEERSPQTPSLDQSSREENALRALFLLGSLDRLLTEGVLRRSEHRYEPQSRVGIAFVAFQQIIAHREQERSPRHCKYILDERTTVVNAQHEFECALRELQTQRIKLVVIQIRIAEDHREDFSLDCFFKSVQSQEEMVDGRPLTQDEKRELLNYMLKRLITENSHPLASSPTSTGETLRGKAAVQIIPVAFLNEEDYLIPC